MCLCAGSLRKQKEVSDLFVSCLMWVLGLKFWSCSRAVSTLRLLSHPCNPRIKLLATQIQHLHFVKNNCFLPPFSFCFKDLNGFKQNYHFVVL